MHEPVMISFVVPAYNEEKRLPATLERISSYLGHAGWEFCEVLVVDDGSTDNTVGAAERAGKCTVRVLRKDDIVAVMDALQQANVGKVNLATEAIADGTAQKK